MVLIGSSENYAGYNPVLAYEEYGFTSYSYVLSATDFSLFEVQLDEVLRVQSPQMIVVDIGEMHRANRSNKDTLFRQIVAAAPFSEHTNNGISRTKMSMPLSWVRIRHCSWISL